MNDTEEDKMGYLERANPNSLYNIKRRQAAPEPKPEPKKVSLMERIKAFLGRKI